MLGFPYYSAEDAFNQEREDIACYADALAFVKPMFNNAFTSELVSKRISELIADDYDEIGYIKSTYLRCRP